MRNQFALLALLAALACAQAQQEPSAEDLSWTSTTLTTATIPTMNPRPDGPTYAVAYTWCDLGPNGSATCQPVITEHPTREEATESFHKLRGTVDPTGRYFRYEDFRLLELRPVEPGRPRK